MAKKSTKKNTPVDAKKPEPKKSELDNLNLADGKVHSDPDIEKVKQLEEILGIKKMNPFGTSNIEIFKEKLRDSIPFLIQSLVVHLMPITIVSMLTVEQLLLSMVLTKKSSLV